MGNVVVISVASARLCCARFNPRRLLTSISICVLALSFFATANFVVARDLVADDETLQLANLQQHFQDVATKVAPSVVAISAAIAPVDADDALRADDLNTQKLDAILDHVTRTVGTGFIIDADGFILTNEHVIGEAQQIWVTTEDHKVYPAIVVGSDPRSDLAVLKIAARGLTQVKFAPSDSVKRGEWAIALGNPYGLAGFGEMAMSVGVVSALDRNLTQLSARENRLYTNLIQTTAQINPGNSGGPLFDLQGRVIGINTAVVMPQKQTNGIGFAMPADDELLAKVRELQAGHEVVYGYMGVMVNNPTPRQRRDCDVPDDAGVMVESFELNSPAAEASLKVGDVILSIDSRKVSSSDQFVRVVGNTPVDHKIPVAVLRDRKPLTLDMTLKRRAIQTAGITQESQRFRWRGLLLGQAPQNAKQSAAGIVVFGIDAKSPFLKEGIVNGAIITAIAGQPVADLITLQHILNDTPIDQCRLTFAKSTADLASANDP